jgi:hypothetical protein
VRTKPYTERGIRQVPCAKCGKPSRHQWQICADHNQYRGLCAECDIEMNAMVMRWIWGLSRETDIMIYTARKRELRRENALARKAVRAAGVRPSPKLKTKQEQLVEILGAARRNTAATVDVRNKQAASWVAGEMGLRHPEMSADEIKALIAEGLKGGGDA